MSAYTTRIVNVLEGWDRPTIDPRHIEAYMRSENTTLDHLSPDAFSACVWDAIECVEMGGVDMAERLATSYGL